MVRSDPRVSGASPDKTKAYIVIKDTLLWEYTKQYLDFDEVVDEDTLRSFSVEVSDGNGGSRTKKVFVDLVDVNDNTPRFCNRTVSPKDGKYCELATSNATKSIASLPENSRKDKVVTDIYVEDLDSADSGHGDVSFEIVSGNAEKMFALVDAPSSSKYVIIDEEKVGVRYRKQLKLIGKLEYDGGGTQQYTIGIRASDCPDVSVCSDSLHSTQEYTIPVSDYNDNAPVFKQTIYTATIKENHPSVTGNNVTAGKALLNQRVVASDKDSGANKALSYAVLDSNQKDVSKVAGVLPDGQLYLKTSIDFEDVGLNKDKKVQLSVRAQDGGSPKLESFAKLVITVQDFNDKIPVWENTQLREVDIKEEQKAGTAVVTVKASDGDLAGTPRSTLVYFISHKNGTAAKSDDFHFADASSGELTTKRELEADGKDASALALTIYVMAKDKGDAVNEPGTGDSASAPLRRALLAHVCTAPRVRDEVRPVADSLCAGA